MEQLLETTTLAFLLVGAALVLIALGLLLTGKKKVKPCGRSGVKEDECDREKKCPVCDEDEK